MTANVDGVVTEADVRAAQSILDLLLPLGQRVPIVTRADAAEARGILAAWSADMRTAGYLEGLQAGRRELGQTLQDLLRDEGLAP